MFEEYITNEYLRAMIVFLVFFIIIRLAIFIITLMSKKLSSKTKTDVDDELVKRLSKPLTVVALVISILITIPELTYAEGVESLLTNITYTFAIVLVGWIIHVIFDVLLIRSLKKLTSKTKSSVDDSLISLFKSIISLAIIILAVLYILSVWGIEIMPLLAGLGIAGLAVALALQPILTNVFSGAAVILDGTAKEGDLIFVGDVKGTIEKIGLRSTKIRNFDNEFMILPNTKLADSVVQNITLPEEMSRATVAFGVAYGSDIEKVKKIVLKELSKVEYVVKDPEPVVMFLEMGDSSLNFKAYYHVDSYKNRFVTIDKVNTRIYKALNKAKIEIPFPQMDVNLKK